MNKDFLKGLLFFVVGFLTARYLMKQAAVLPIVNTNMPTVDTQQEGIAVNVDGIVNNVKTWLKENFPEMSDIELQGYAEQAIGVASGSPDVNTDNPEVAGNYIIAENASGYVRPYHDYEYRMQGLNDISRSVDSEDSKEIFPTGSTIVYPGTKNAYTDRLGRRIVSRSPDANDMRMANGVDNRNKMGKLESDFKWSFN